MVQASGAHSTDMESSEDVERLTAECEEPAHRWAQEADRLWVRRTRITDEEMKEETNMEKNKLAMINEKIAEIVVDAYQKVEDGVVGAYQKVESSVVGAYRRVEDGFVERFLTCEGETVEQARQRLSGEAKDPK